MRLHKELFKSAPTDITLIQRLIHSELSNQEFVKQASKFIKLLMLLPKTIDVAFNTPDFSRQLVDIKSSNLLTQSVKKELFQLKTQEIMGATLGDYLSADMQDTLKRWLLKQYQKSLISRDTTQIYYQKLQDFKSACLKSTDEDRMSNEGPVSEI